MEQKPNNKEQDLNKFRSKIEALKMLEEKNKDTTHFTDCNPAELNEEDKNLYEKYTANNLSINEFREYREEMEGKSNQSQIIFTDYIANMLSRNISRKNS